MVSKGRVRPQESESGEGATPEGLSLVAYMRVSTDKQAEHGQGLDVQRATIRQWAKANGHKVTAWHTDKGVSGSQDLDVREGLFDAMRALQEGEADGLIVYRLDRLARDFMLQEMLLNRCWSLGGEVFSCSDTESHYLRRGEDAAADPSRKLVRQVMGAVAEYERAMIRLRMRAGKLEKRAQGGYIGGRLPYGSELVDGEIVDSPTERATLARMRELRASGLSIRGVCEALNAEGFHTRGGKPWHAATVDGLLKRDSTTPPP